MFTNRQEVPAGDLSGSLPGAGLEMI